jgi:hypothetical protein
LPLALNLTGLASRYSSVAIEIANCAG